MLNSIFFILPCLVVTSVYVLTLLGKFTWSWKWPLLTIGITPVSPMRIIGCLGLTMLLFLQLTGLGSKLVLPAIDLGTMPQIIVSKHANQPASTSQHERPTPSVESTVTKTPEPPTPPAPTNLPAPAAPTNPGAAATTRSQQDMDRNRGRIPDWAKDKDGQPIL